MSLPAFKGAKARTPNPPFNNPGNASPSQQAPLPAGLGGEEAGPGPSLLRGHACFLTGCPGRSPARCLRAARPLRPASGWPSPVGRRADGGGRAPGSLSDGVEFKKRSLNGTFKHFIRMEQVVFGLGRLDSESTEAQR
nr:transmembrane protein 267 isoform X2 [Zonotrichia albicollis]